MRRFLGAAYLIFAGVLLIVAPWTMSWQHDNYFGTRFVLLGVWMTNEFVRGAVTGVGLITAFAGLRDVAALMFANRSLER